MMRSATATLCLTIGLSGAVAMLASMPPAGAGMLEKRVQECGCFGMEREVAIPSGGRADCVSSSHAIEIDRTSSWANAIGQSLYYAEQLGKRPRVILFCDDDTPALCQRHIYRFRQTVEHYGLPIDLAIMDGSTVAAACDVR